MRVGNTSANSLTPVLAATRAAAISAGSRKARPPSSNAFLPPACSTRAIAAMASSELRGGGVSVGGGAGTPPSLQDTSAGRISVATCPGGPYGRGDGFDGIAAQGLRALRGAHPGGDVARDGLDVGLQLCVVLDVVGGVVADDVDHGHPALARVVQVGESVAQAAAEMQQGRGRFAGHACVAIGRARGDALEEAEHGAHFRRAVERGDEMHLRGAGIAEADRDAGIHEGAHQGVGAVRHGGIPCKGEGGRPC